MRGTTAVEVGREYTWRRQVDGQTWRVRVTDIWRPAGPSGRAPVHDVSYETLGAQVAQRRCGRWRGSSRAPSGGCCGSP